VGAISGLGLGEPDLTFYFLVLVISFFRQTRSPAIFTMDGHGLEIESTLYCISVIMLYEISLATIFVVKSL